MHRKEHGWLPKPHRVIDSPDAPLVNKTCCFCGKPAKDQDDMTIFVLFRQDKLPKCECQET